jgi:flagellar hook-associated protein 2
MTSVPAYQASGLASKLNTQDIIDSLVTIEAMPLQDLAKKQSAISVQISSIGSLMSSLDSLNASASFLGSNGLASISAIGTYNDFSISGTASTAGRYTMKVEDLARAAKVRSTTTYNASTDVVNVGADTLSVSVDGVGYNIAVAAGTKLSDLADQINKSTGATLAAGGTATTLPFTASVLSDGTHSFLTLTSKNLGHRVGQAADDALTVTHDIGLGLDGTGLAATNAAVWVDGLRMERRTNDITDIVPGATFSLKNASNTNAEVVFANDTSQASGRLNAFINQYNKVATFLQGQLTTSPGATTDDKINGSVLLGLQRRMQSTISTEVNTTGSIRTLRDLGVSLQKDGTIALKEDTLTAALNKDPNAVNTIFTKASTGIGALVKNLVTSQNDTKTGALVARRTGLQSTTKSITDQASRMQLHLDAYRAQLNVQFTSLERIMSGVNQTASFLDQQSAQLNAKR